MASPDPPNSELIVSYLTLRKAIGLIGIAMPIIVRVGARYFEGIPSNASISAYYYTGMRDIFVGALAAIGIFLFCYRGTDKQDNILTNVAGAWTFAVGLLPTEPGYHPVIVQKFPQVMSGICYQNHGPLGYHIYVVGAFFLIISYLTIFRFTKPSQPHVTTRKKSRNKVYVVCGIVMLLSLGAIVLLKWKSPSISIFWPETVAILAFGVAWLTKGHAILADNTSSAEG